MSPPPDNDAARPAAAENAEAPAEDLSALGIEELTTAGDVDSLLALAKAHRAGTCGVAKDLGKCLEAYRAAAKLGSAEAEYAVALFHLSGGIVDKDMKEGTSRLRAAATMGHLQAKIYLANLYELGVHYKADSEKADVWYRNAARTAQIKLEADSPEYVRAMAELGCVRQCLALIEGGSLESSEREFFLKKAKALGYQHKLREERIKAGERASIGDAEAARQAERTSEIAEAPAKATSAKKVKAKNEETNDEKDETPEKEEDSGPSRLTLGAGIASFFYAALFVAAAAGAGYAATQGAKLLIAKGEIIPLIGTRIELVFPIVLGALGALPTFLIYRAVTVLRALVAGAALGGVGWVAWGTGEGALHASRAMQASAFGIAGFLAVLLVLGCFGGAKPHKDE